MSVDYRPSAPPADADQKLARWTMEELYRLSGALEGLAVSDAELFTSMAQNGLKTVNKFGASEDLDIANGMADIWDGMTSAGKQTPWLAPTAARIHNITRSSAQDWLTGTGAQRVRVYGLTDWDSPETFEDLDLDIATKPTVNAYVIIHRIEVIQVGSAGSNQGLIACTAVTDATQTARIVVGSASGIGNNQTLMAVYGVPRGQTAFMTRYYTSTSRDARSYACLSQLLVNPMPDIDTTMFQVKHQHNIVSEGTSFVEKRFEPYFAIEGPAIIKVAALTSTDSVDVNAGFDLILK